MDVLVHPATVGLQGPFSTFDPADHVHPFIYVLVHNWSNNYLLEWLLGAVHLLLLHNDMYLITVLIDNQVETDNTGR